MINKIITNVVLGSTRLGGGMIGLTMHPLATAKPLPKEQPKYDDEATEKLKVLRWTMDFKKCMEFLKGEGKNADPNVSVGNEHKWSNSDKFYPGITLLEEAILHGSLEDVRMLISNKNVRGIDLEIQEYDPDYRPGTPGPKYSRTLMHTAVASPEEMENRWNQQFRDIKSWMESEYADLTTKYPDLITKKDPNLEDHKLSDPHASEEIVQFLIDAFKEREKEWVLKVNEKNPIHNKYKKTTPLDLVEDYLNPENVKNYTGKKKENYEKHKEEYMRIRDLLKKTLDDIDKTEGSMGYQRYMMSLH
jgi:hypothetical protein